MSKILFYLHLLFLQFSLSQTVDIVPSQDIPVLKDKNNITPIVFVSMDFTGYPKQHELIFGPIEKNKM